MEELERPAQTPDFISTEHLCLRTNTYLTFSVARKVGFFGVPFNRSYWATQDRPIGPIVLDASMLVFISD